MRDRQASRSAFHAQLTQVAVVKAQLCALRLSSRFERKLYSITAETGFFVFGTLWPEVNSDQVGSFVWCGGIEAKQTDNRLVWGLFTVENVVVTLVNHREEGYYNFLLGNMEVI